MNQRNDEFLFGAVVGSGLTAKAADKSGAHYLLALNAGRFRVQGASSLTSLLPVRSANDWVVEFAEREMLGRCEAPIFAGLSVCDPNLNLEHLIKRTQDLGFAGVCNFPSSILVDGRLGALLEREGLGFTREIELVETAAEMGMRSFVYVQTNTQARKMVDAGATAICVNIGFTSGGTGVSTQLTLKSAAALIERALEGVPASVDKLCHGGPITSPEDALAIRRICSVQGFVAGSSLDRLPVEEALSEVTRGFTAIPSLHRIKTPEPQDHGLIGSSLAIQKLRADIGELSHQDTNILIVGETGTGKTRAAQTLHSLGPNSGREAISVDCAALDTTTAGPYLLGYVPGVVAGVGSQRGALERAANSTLILDEVSALSNENQGKLLKFCDEGSVVRIGDHSPRPSNARIVATSSQELNPSANQDNFRKDLYYRLSEHVLELPPLRDRSDDIPELANFFGTQILGEAPQFSNAVLKVMLEYQWPGNVRELSSAVRRALFNSGGGTVDLKSIEFLRLEKISNTPQHTEFDAPKRPLSEQEWIESALTRNGYNRTKTARELGITTRTLYNKIKRYGIQA